MLLQRVEQLEAELHARHGVGGVEGSEWIRKNAKKIIKRIESIPIPDSFVILNVITVVCVFLSCFQFDFNWTFQAVQPLVCKKSSQWAWCEVLQGEAAMIGLSWHLFWPFKIGLKEGLQYTCLYCMHMPTLFFPMMENVHLAYDSIQRGDAKEPPSDGQVPKISGTGCLCHVDPFNSCWVLQSIWRLAYCSLATGSRVFP